MSKIIQIEEEVLAKALATNFAGIQLVTGEMKLEKLTKDMMMSIYDTQMFLGPETVIRAFARDFDNIIKK